MTDTDWAKTKQEQLALSEAVAERCDEKVEIEKA